MAKCSRLIVAILLVSAATSANAMTYYLVKEWTRNGDQMCQYEDGTVLNVGVRICPQSRKSEPSNSPRESAPVLKRYLEAEWSQNGDQMCRYDDGTVLNMGIRVCPLSLTR
jgi:hypothetical protein